MQIFTARIEAEYPGEPSQFFTWGESEPEARARLVAGVTREFRDAARYESTECFTLAVALKVLSQERARDLEEGVEDTTPLTENEIVAFGTVLNTVLTPMVPAGKDYIWL